MAQVLLGPALTVHVMRYIQSHQPTYHVVEFNGCRLSHGKVQPICIFVPAKLCQSIIQSTRSSQQGPPSSPASRATAYTMRAPYVHEQPHQSHSLHLSQSTPSKPSPYKPRRNGAITITIADASAVVRDGHRPRRSNHRRRPIRSLHGHTPRKNEPRPSVPTIRSQAKNGRTRSLSPISIGRAPPRSRADMGLAAPHTDAQSTKIAPTRHARAGGQRRQTAAIRARMHGASTGG